LEAKSGRGRPKAKGKGQIDSRRPENEKTCVQNTKKTVRVIVRHGCPTGAVLIYKHPWKRSGTGAPVLVRQKGLPAS